MDIRRAQKNSEAILRPVVEGMGYELVDVKILSEAGRLVLRVMADREGGITLDECARISRELAPHLDIADPISSRYSLEVSSPGIRRPLKRPEDFTRFAGILTTVKLSEPLGGRKRFTGIGRGLDAEGNLILEMTDTGERVTIPLTSIDEAKLDPEIKFSDAPKSASAKARKK
jgi:ribosome maturation factor RimP